MTDYIEFNELTDDQGFLRRIPTKNLDIPKNEILSRNVQKLILNLYDERNNLKNELKRLRNKLRGVENEKKEIY